MPRRSQQLVSPGSLALLYFLVGSVYIFFSDRILVRLFPGLTMEALTRLQTIKGLAFVVLSALLLLVMARMGHAAAADRAGEISSSEARYRQLFERTSVAILVVDSASEAIVDANPAAERFYGWHRGELVGRPIREIVAMDEGEFRAEQDLALRERRQHLQLRHATAGGDLREVEVHASPLDLGGRNHTVLLVQDITTRLSAERRLEHSERRYRQLMEEASDAIILADRDGRIQKANHRTEELFGYTAEELAGMAILDLLPDRTPAEHPVSYHILREQGRLLVEQEIHRRDGSPLSVEVHASLLGDGSMQAIIRDVSERRRMENQLRQAQKMEAVGQLTGGIAHDLNNILTVIQANADLIATALEPNQAESREDLAELQGAARRGAAMIRKLLGFSRHARLSPSPHRPGTLLAELEPTLRRLLPENLEFHALDRSGGAVVRTDPVAFEQIVLNLCTNARDAMPAGGVLEVTLDRRRVAPDPAHTWRIPGEHIALVVHDSGVGMTAEAQARVFEPFYTTKSAGQGTGLGMAMVYGLARQQGGFVELESQVGQGTTVTVYMPLAASPEGREAIRQSEPQSKSSGGNETILLVEDEPALRRAADRILQRLGYDVLLARDGEEAVSIMQTEGTRVDLVLADVVLPKLSGGRFLDLLRDRGWQGKILLTSGYSVSDAAWAGVSMADEIPFLPKPWTFDDLARKVREVLDTGPPG